MKFVNTHGLAFIGPGSEWFWTAASGLVLFVTFVAIYRQLRLQARALMREELDRITHEWQGERLLRARLAVLRRIRDGEPLDYTTPQVWNPCTFWENVGSMARYGRMDIRVLRQAIETMVVYWWHVMAPHIARMREKLSEPDSYANFEWLAMEMERSGPVVMSRQMAAELYTSPKILDARICALEEEIRQEEMLRSAH